MVPNARKVVRPMDAGVCAYIRCYPSSVAWKIGFGEFRINKKLKTSNFVAVCILIQLRDPIVIEPIPRD